MANADWWARVVQARTRHDDLLPQRIWALRKDGHEAAINIKAVPGLGAEIVFNGARRMAALAAVSLARAAELVGAIADTRAMFEANG